jgi:aminoglycoside phosphotransferase (APT) family kinase protein
VIYAPPDRARLAAYLGDRLRAAEVVVTDVKRSWPGMSRETWFVSTELTVDGATSPRRFVFRMDPPGGGFHLTSLGFEAAVYRILEQTDVPTQPLLWHEPAGNVWVDHGREFFVRAWVDGTVEPDHVRDPDPQYDPVRERVVKELVEKLAMVHDLDWRALHFDEIAHYVPTSVEDAAAVEIDWHLDHVLHHGTEPYPALTEALLTMRNRLPSPSARVVIRKENNGIGEEIWQGQTIVAMADWESASLGAPELDLAVAARTTFGLWGVDEALAYYERVTGTAVNMESFAFYQRMWSMRAIVGLQGGIPGFSTQRDQRLQLASLGLLTIGMQSLLAEAAGF